MRLHNAKKKRGDFIMPSGVYLIENKTQNKYYVGSSFDIEKRLSQHFSLLKSGNHTIKDMQDDYNNGDVFNRHIIKNLNTSVKSYLLEEEARSIKEYAKKGILYNTLLMEHNHFISEEVLKNQILDCYCMDHFGMSYRALTSHSLSAEIEMIYKIIKCPNDEEEIKAEYTPIIDYQKNVFNSYTHNITWYKKELEKKGSEKQ